MNGGGASYGQLWILCLWSVGEGSGIPSVAVSYVDIRRNAGDEGGLLDDD